jgi:TusE/DsrC/DsvC family sulfur relay protein
MEVIMKQEQSPLTMKEILHPGHGPVHDAEFPHAPEEWSRQQALEYAARENLDVSDAHWEVIRAIQEFYQRHDEYHINKRALIDALEERFHQQGGMKYLYTLLPGGPLAMGCHLAGLEPPAGATDKGFGSVA